MEIAHVIVFSTVVFDHDPVAEIHFEVREKLYSLSESPESVYFEPCFDSAPNICE